MIEQTEGSRPQPADHAVGGQTQYHLMRMLEANPAISQRDVALALGVSLGKVNYSLRALMRKGWVKAANFKNSKNKSAYLYLLTPHGIEEKARLSVLYLKIKMQEYERLKAEIEQMRREAGELAPAGADETDA